MFELTIVRLAFLFCVLYVVGLGVGLMVLHYYYRRVMKRAVDELHMQYMRARQKAADEAKARS